MTVDPFDTAALRSAVLRAWRESPARLREDANVEEDHARGYYRDRVLVELAQNAADAAVRAGVPGRLLLRLTELDGGPVLVAANTGAPLDAPGVAALAAMRASAKREGHGPAVVGRFGVGFAAVRAVADEIAVLSTTGAVRFSLADTTDELAAASAAGPALAEEVRRRDGSLPALRLPFAASGRPPEGFDTAVVLQLRDEVAADEVRTLLRGVDDALLLALPGLVEVMIEDETGEGPPLRRLTDPHQRWLVVSAEGEVAPALLADRPVEERAATGWRVTWALPRTAEARVPAAGARVVHAPTPTDEPLDLPAVLIATFPLDPTRRHVSTGPLTDALVEHAADAYATLARTVAADGGDVLGLVPTSLAAGPLDGALRRALVERLARTPLLVPAGTAATDGPAREAEHDDRPAHERTEGLVAPARAVAVVTTSTAALAVLGRRIASLVAVAPDRLAHARTLGVELRTLTDLVEDLPSTGPADDWAELYDALDALGAGERDRAEALAALPVPLADGRVVRGARGTCVLDADLAERVAGVLPALASWGVRVVDPAAAHPLLERLGAQTPDATGLLRLPPVRAAVLAWDDEHADDEHADDERTDDERADDERTDDERTDDGRVDDDGADVAGSSDLTTAVLTLVAAALPPRDPGRWRALAGTSDALPDDVREWLALVPLRSATGERVPADGLVLPGTPAHRLLDERVLGAVARSEVDRWGAATLVAAGVREDLVSFTVPDVLTDQAEPAADEPGALLVQALDGWDEFLDELTRRCGAGTYVGDVVAVADLDAVAPDAWPETLERLCAELGLRRALLEPVRSDRGVLASSYTAWWLRNRAPLGLDGPFVVPGTGRALAGLLPPAPEAVAGLDVDVLRALGGVRGPRDVARADWTNLLDGWPLGAAVEVRVAATLWRFAAPDEPPDRVPAFVAAGQVAVVAAHDAAVAPSPMWWQRTDVAALVPAPDDDEAHRLARALDLPSVAELAAGRVTRDDGSTLEVAAAVRALLPDVPQVWCEHEELRVDHVPVEWWVDGAGPDARLHATTLAGLAAAIAQTTGRWSLRHAIEAVLADESRAGDVVLDVAWAEPEPEA
ncbi:sacsin N-terminal ATP-binding-like domain-containing protein [Cellulomonas composti]|uniref:ATP-binding protein n=1 Tax=Cellulomonas composti TaxID=266130 RepID=A0A511JDI6_9CELL|nr:ATP-binding protein [Cellulomonas composti]GEL95849.1 hypothetical protein CCO02nite_25070 [Cellulomonas composti]